MRGPLLTVPLAAVLMALRVTATAQEPTPAKGDAGAQGSAPSTQPGKTPASAKPPAVGKNWTIPDVGMEFVWVEALKLHVATYEVTNGEYLKKDPQHDSQEFSGHSLNGDRQPVVFVSFEDATAYAAWLTERERAAGRLPAGWRYRLPTGDEWLAFAKCGDDREYPWGNEPLPKYGNYHDESGAGGWGKLGL